MQPDDDDDGQAIGYQVLPEGTPVVTSDGETLGTVAKVLDNVRERIFDGIAVRTADRVVFVDAPEVARIAERRVTLTISAAEAAGLDEYSRETHDSEYRPKRRTWPWQRRSGR